jgi:hypothetical protein
MYQLAVSAFEKSVCLVSVIYLASLARSGLVLVCAMSGTGATAMSCENLFLCLCFKVLQIFVYLHSYLRVFSVGIVCSLPTNITTESQKNECNNKPLKNFYATSVLEGHADT